MTLERSAGREASAGRRPWPRLRVRALAALFAVAGPGSAGALAAQEAAPAGIRVVGRFDPGSGETTYEVAEPLGGREVLAVQRALLRAGASSGAPDGRLGPGTRAALESFQRERGLRPCGCVSYPTVLALGLEPRVTQVVVGSASRRAAGEPPVRVIRPRGIPWDAGAPGRAARSRPGDATEPGRDETGARIPARYGETYWIPVIVPGGVPVPAPGDGAVPVSRPTPAGAPPPGIRPAPPPRVTPPPASAPRTRGRPGGGGSGRAG